MNDIARATHDKPPRSKPPNRLRQLRFAPLSSVTIDSYTWRRMTAAEITAHRCGDNGNLTREAEKLIGLICHSFATHLLETRYDTRTIEP